ncbi:hypothetical protein MA16_Dca000375 [Dendrobium catenatum]|uniref:Uncharacterized protein n=1 Tax=Dendrobium catenatum TaxID=906689 RepID=A0A2I0WTP9_9ASPA|nr:hypothetical protein MA16_Dca000375 [Dendrobium catenatum]
MDLLVGRQIQMMDRKNKAISRFFLTSFSKICIDEIIHDTIVLGSTDTFKYLVFVVDIDMPPIRPACLKMC